MPYTINGIGTWYWGKRNVHEEVDQCRHCQRQATLKSYDTGLYFVVFYIPLLPLGRQRILRHCPHCTRHNVMPLKEWDRTRRETLTQAAQNFQRAPDNAEVAKDMLRACAVYQDRPAFDAVAGSLRERFRADPEVLQALVQAYDYFGDHERAAEAAGAALALDPASEQLRHQAAIQLVHCRRTAEAASLLAPRLQRAAPEDQTVHWLLAQGYQAEGRHAEALEVFQRLAERYPASAQLKEFRKARRASEKRLGKGKPFVVPQLAASGTKSAGVGIWTGGFARWFAPVLLGLVLCAYVAFAFQLGSNRRVYLVNGLDRASVVMINGQRHDLRPHGVKEVRVAEGEVRVGLADGRASSVRLESSFLLRPFSQAVTALNPDQCAILAADRIVYRTKNSQVEGGTERNLRPPALVHELAGFDKVFEPPPETVSLSSATSVAYRLCLSQLPVRSADEGYSLLKSGVSAAEAARFARRWAEFHPDDETALAVAAGALPAEQLRELVQPMLARRPVNIEAHRLRQNFAGTFTPALRDEYRALLEAEPGNMDLVYLLGRVTEDRAQALAYFRQAADAPQPSPDASYALAYDAAGVADWPEALSRIRAALRLKPAKERFQGLERVALLGLRRYEEILALPQTRQAATSVYAGTAGFPILLQDAAGDRAGADRAARSYLERLQGLAKKRAVGQDFVEQGQAMLEAQLLAQRGDLLGAAGALDRMKDATASCVASELRGRWAVAVSGFEKLSEGGLRQALRLYAGAAKEGDSAADKAWEHCLRLAKDRARSGLSPLDLMEGRQPITLENVRGLVLDTEEKAAMAAALAMRAPAERRALLDFARSLAVHLGLENALLRRLAE